MSSIEQLLAFHRSDPENLHLVGDLLDELLRLGRFETATEVLQGLADAVRDAPPVRFREARLALARGELEAAADMLRTLLDAGADVPAVRHDLALVLSHLGRDEAAVEVLKPALSAEPLVPEVYLLHTRLLYRGGDLEGALDAVASVLASAPDEATALGLKALLLLDSGDVEAAQRVAADVLQSDPAQPDAALVAGTVALWGQRVDDAQAAFDRALSSGAHAGRALSGLGQAHMLRGDLVQAKKVLHDATLRMPDHIGTWHALAWCQLLSAEIDAAQTSFERSFALDRSFGETHGGFAIVQVLRGRTEDAEGSIKRAQRLDPTGRNAAYARALLQLESGNDAAATQTVQGILQATAATRGEDADAVLRQLHALMRDRRH